MTIFEAGKNLTQQLTKLYDQREATNITSMILEKITGFSTAERLMHKYSTLSKTQENQLQDFTRELLQHKPIQYVLNEAWFAGMRFYVDENVLIPRPETEELVDIIITEANALTNKNLSVLDIGTGSGCIAISIKKKIASAVVYALEINKNALNVSKKNATDNKAEIEFFLDDILNINSDMHFPYFDIIVSNPPYIKESEATEMRQNVLKYEPKQALFVPDEDALVFYKAIADFSLNYLKAEGRLYFEINEMMADEVAELLKERSFSSIRVLKDLQGKNRFVSAVINKDGIL